METCKSPWKVMQTAHVLACQCLPLFSSPFSRHDFTLPQLFACLVVKDQLKRSYRGAETLLRDSQSWLDDIGMSRAPHPQAGTRHAVPGRRVPVEAITG